MTVITLNISEPITSVHLNPSLDGAREIQVIDFVRIARPYIILKEPQGLNNMDDCKAELISLGDGDFTFDVLKRSLKAIDKGIEIMNQMETGTSNQGLNSNSAKGLHRTWSTRNSYSW